MNLTRCHIHALWEQKIRTTKRDGVLLIYKVLWVRRGRCTKHRDCRVVRRKGRVYVINKTQRRFKARQG